MVIDSFRGAHAWLSNFYPAPIRLDDVVYATVEHAYQAAKTLDPSERRIILGARTPAEAKRLGRFVALREDWDRIQLPLMLNLLRVKFRPGTELSARLLATGNALLVEGNTWGDTFWGVSNGRGQNHLGRLLMQVRAELK